MLSYFYKAIIVFLIIFSLEDLVFAKFLEFKEIFKDECVEYLGSISPSDSITLQNICDFSQKTVGKSPLLSIPSRIINWGSGGFGGIPWQFSNQDCNRILIEIFEKITHKIIGLKLSPHDLFHGHVISFTQGIAIVFHAKEYPKDIEYIKNQYQVVDEIFYSRDNCFKKRNFIFYSDNNENGVYLINNNNMCAELFSDYKINTLDENLLIDKINNAKLVGDINVFNKTNIGRIKYLFYPSEQEQTGKNINFRIEANSQINDLILKGPQEKILYLLTGISSF